MLTLEMIQKIGSKPKRSEYFAGYLCRIWLSHKLGMARFIFCFKKSVAKMQKKVIVGFGFDANSVLTAWFCCNMSRSHLDIFSGVVKARLPTSF